MPPTKSSAPRPIGPMFIWPSPNQEDLLFWVEKNGDLTVNQDFAYGDAYPDAAKYPNHKLVHVSAQVNDRWSKWFYASDWINEDEHNWKLSQGEELVRSYFVKRSLYFARTETEAEEANSSVVGEFTCPVAASLDSRFSKFGFADDTVLEAPSELAGLYIIVKRRYLEPVEVRSEYSPSFNKRVKTTRTIVPASTTPESLPADTPGSTYALIPGNSFHKIVERKELVLGEDEFPYSLPSLPKSVDMKFPPRLEQSGVEFVGVSAYAASSDAAPSYSEDYYFHFALQHARPGPYNGYAERWITDNPQDVRALNPLTTIPQPVEENISIVAAWWLASDKGNSTSATAKEWRVDPCIHGPIAITKSGAAAANGSFDSTWIQDLPATPGYSTFIALGEAALDYSVKELEFGLYEVSIIRVDISGLYSAIGSYTYSNVNGGDPDETLPTPEGTVAWDLVDGESMSFDLTWDTLLTPSGPYDNYDDYPDIVRIPTTGPLNTPVLKNVLLHISTSSNPSPLANGITLPPDATSYEYFGADPDVPYNTLLYFSIRPLLYYNHIRDFSVRNSIYASLPQLRGQSFTLLTLPGPPGVATTSLTPTNTDGNHVIELIIEAFDAGILPTNVYRLVSGVPTLIGDELAATNYSGVNRYVLFNDNNSYAYLDGNTLYEYELRTVNATGESFSLEVSALTYPDAPGAPLLSEDAGDVTVSLPVGIDTSDITFTLFVSVSGGAYAEVTNGPAGIFPFVDDNSSFHYASPTELNYYLIATNATGDSLDGTVATITTS